ncbi:MAG: DUF4440 domain-containing protein, partial [Acidobacteria bacterium]|nr:DUF4440 domain-containing protein [Acidobacteriota bacterium]
MTHEQQEVFNVVLELNRAWVARERAGIDERVTDDIVEVSEYSPYRLEGREEYMRGIDAYIAGPFRVHSHIERGPLVKLFGDVALVTFYFDQEIQSADSPRLARTGKETHMLRR